MVREGELLGAISLPGALRLSTWLANTREKSPLMALLPVHSRGFLLSQPSPEPDYAS